MRGLIGTEKIFRARLDEDAHSFIRRSISRAFATLMPRRVHAFERHAFAPRNGMRRSLLIAALIALTMLSACGSRRATARVPTVRTGTTEEGIASWYGEPYHGRRAANGEVFDMEQFTAAHPSLPFETWVRVRLLATKKETEVRITDRGPFVKGRIIDLSRAAARDIELLRAGTAKVRVTVIAPPKDLSSWPSVHGAR